MTFLFNYRPNVQHTYFDAILNATNPTLEQFGGFGIWMIWIEGKPCGTDFEPGFGLVVNECALTITHQL